MNVKIKKYIPFMDWIIEVAEEKIIEHRLVKKEFKSNEEFIIFTIVWLRVYKSLFQKIKNNKVSTNNKNSEESYDRFIKNFYKNQKNQYLGITINAISRESNVPRSTVKRIVENLIKKNLLKRNINRLIIPTPMVRDVMRDYRKYIFRSNKKIFEIYNKLNIENLYEENDNL